MLRKIISESLESLTNVLPRNINVLYHFTDADIIGKILRSNKLQRGYINYGLDGLVYSRPKYAKKQNLAISFTRNKLLFWGYNSSPFDFALLFDRNYLQRFYKLIPVQPHDERPNYRKRFTGDEYVNIIGLNTRDKKDAHARQWDEEIIIGKDVEKLDKVLYGILIRDKNASSTNWLKGCIDVLEYLKDHKIKIYFQNTKGVIYKEIADANELDSYIDVLHSQNYSRRA